MAVQGTKTKFELERDARILENKARLAEICQPEIDAWRSNFPVVVRKPPQPKPLPPPRNKSTRAASLKAREAVTAIVNFEKSADPYSKQPKQPRAMVNRAEGPVLETTRDFLLAYAGYSECDADTPEALPDTLAVLQRNTVGLKDILAITDTDPVKIIGQLKDILPDAKPVELTRMARGLCRFRDACASRSSGSEAAAGGSTGPPPGRKLRLPTAAQGRLKAHVDAYKITLGVNDYSVAITFTEEKLAPHNPTDATTPSKKNIMTVAELVVAMRDDLKVAGIDTEPWTDERLREAISNKFKNSKDGALKRQAADRELRLAKKKAKLEGSEGGKPAPGTPDSQQSNQPQGEATGKTGAVAEPEIMAAGDQDGTEQAPQVNSGRQTRASRGRGAAAAAQQAGAAAPAAAPAKAVAAAANRSKGKDQQTQQQAVAAASATGSQSTGASAECVQNLTNLEPAALVALMLAAMKTNPDLAQQVQAAAAPAAGQ